MKYASNTAGAEGGDVILGHAIGKGKERTSSHCSNASSESSLHPTMSVRRPSKANPSRCSFVVSRRSYRQDKRYDSAWVRFHFDNLPDFLFSFKNKASPNRGKSRTQKSSTVNQRCNPPPKKKMSSTHSITKNQEEIEDFLSNQLGHAHTRTHTPWRYPLLAAAPWWCRPP